MKKTASITSTSRHNDSLHWAYLEFAIRSSRAKVSQRKKTSIPASRNVIEAIRYSYDFLGAAAEFAYAITKDGPDGDCRPVSWLVRHVDRRWDSLSLAEKLGFLSFTKSGEGFWRSERQFQLFAELRSVRNALTHPSSFGVEVEEQFNDFDGPALPSRKVIHGKLRHRKDAIASFAQALAALDQQDGRKAVEIALRHGERFEELFGRPGEHLFGRVNPRTAAAECAGAVLARMKHRYFDSAW